MIVVGVSGGLGNQMFQYAFAKSLEFHYKIPVKLDISFYEKQNLRVFDLDKFNTSFQIATADDLSFFKKSFSWFKGFPFVSKNTQIYKEKKFTYDPCVFQLKMPVYLDGYWQSFRYFEVFREIFLQDFSLKRPSFEFQKWCKLISGRNSISIHVRRGDYVSNPQTNAFHGTCSLDYYQQALSSIRCSEPLYIVFSDDLDWVKNNLSINGDCLFVEDLSDEEQLVLMSKTSHNIIANSSFSWWGSWLNINSNQIVCCPLRWFQNCNIDLSDLFIPSWLKI